MDSEEQALGVPYHNTEGYPDPTAHKALKSVLWEQHLREQEAADARCAQLIRVLKGAVDLAGFELLARIEVRDTKTGRVYR